MVKPTVNSGGLVKAAEYARMRGVSQAAISKAISAGSITTFDGLIHPDLADAQWYSTSRAARQQVLAGAPAPASGQAAGPAAGEGSAPGGARQRMDDELWQELKRDEARRAKAEADTAEMKAAQLAGRLIEAEPFLQALTDAAASLGAALERIPDKLAERLAAEADATACHQLLTQEIQAVREDVASAVERLGQRVDDQQHGAPAT